EEDGRERGRERDGVEAVLSHRRFPAVANERVADELAHQPHRREEREDEVHHLPRRAARDHTKREEREERDVRDAARGRECLVRLFDGAGRGAHTDCLHLTACGATPRRASPSIRLYFAGRYVDTLPMNCRSAASSTANFTWTSESCGLMSRFLSCGAP